ncbi:hypothetical protein TOPB45_0108 [Thermodesulfobacterium geofontis OPF15]|jgi:hypothetical protein|uniref:Uncharacterized protein n=1 Tax=Thermodesulfobacterium geofontis (strain OPF15) TaxID=795359 RepID=F8C2D4_THEGP|nr:hypothetical protein [Thermodesulfobacterium geofontis]AEH22224.1 hypothetical protein TOPB45_0108 [Thermodesulfobacterium geofontis OPF15]
MKYFLILILIVFPSLVLAQIRIGILPTEFKGQGVPSQFKENIENTIYNTLTVPSQIEIISLKERDFKKKKVNVNYFLKSFIEIAKDKAKIELNLIEASSSKSFYSVKENISSSEISSKLVAHLEEIKKRLLSLETASSFSYSEEKPFLSKINPFSMISGFFSRIFSKKEEFDIKVPVPPPPPPPGYIAKPYSPPYYPYTQTTPKVSPEIPSDKKTSTPSPWQWF